MRALRAVKIKTLTTNVLFTFDEELLPKYITVTLRSNMPMSYSTLANKLHPS